MSPSLLLGLGCRCVWWRPPCSVSGAGRRSWRCMWVRGGWRGRGSNVYSQRPCGGVSRAVRRRAWAPCDGWPWGAVSPTTLGPGCGRGALTCRRGPRADIVSDAQQRGCPALWPVWFVWLRSSACRPDTKTWQGHSSAWSATPGAVHADDHQHHCCLIAQGHLKVSPV